MTSGNAIWEVMTYSPEETRQVGRVVGELLEPGDTLLLCGPLGVGKTRMAGGIGQGLEVAVQMTSPTYTYVMTYYGRIPLVHMDLYRLYESHFAVDGLSEETLDGLGFFDYLDGQAAALIEWPEGVSEYLEDCLWIQGSYGTDGDARLWRMESRGFRSASLLGEWRKLWSRL
ncbi:MAG: tRNA (adenosine(37)-N6)-threonylcarbamoyltransferase complex ATPase subunit type 1 TsaE [Alicyclobacillaceae bacterium]|nr:tRNA (adenosine(37)-N6)-threonylcarbamoyltransferase complex ATPase subunit type 1 TsaE [Alicyclobacillaceae bacterium]